MAKKTEKVISTDNVPTKYPSQAPMQDEPKPKKKKANK